MGQFPNHAPGTTLRPDGPQAPRNGVLIVNMRSRRGQEAFAQMQAQLRDLGVKVDAAHALAEPSHLPDVLRGAIAQGAKLVIVGGGDGSFRTAAELLAYTDVTLGVLPLGTVNDFARNLGIAPTIESACETIAAGRTAQVDLGQANEHYFVITASLGFSAQTQRALTPGLKKVFGPCGYLLASLIALRRIRPMRLTLQSEQGEECIEAVQAGVVNGHTWMGGKCEIPGMNLESGRLAFYAIPPQSGLKLFRMARNLMRCRFFHTPGLRAFTTRDVMVRMDTPEALVVDGDLCDQTPVRLRVAPAALRVCVPADLNVFN